MRALILALALLGATITHGAIQLDFADATIVHSNLGGEGPDGGEERILYEGVGNVDGTSLDLEVREVSVAGNDYMAHNTASTMIVRVQPIPLPPPPSTPLPALTHTPPLAHALALSPEQNGDFGQINMKADREATFEFCFLFTASGEQAVLEEFGYVYHDFDSGNDDRERLRASGYSEYLTSEDLADADGPVPTQLDITALDDGRVQFTSTEKGIGKDNAADPDNLSDLQKSRMVQLRYTNTACVTLTFSIILGDADEPAFSTQEYGRNFLFEVVGPLVPPWVYAPPSPPPVPPPPSPPPPTPPPPSPPPPTPPPPSPPPPTPPPPSPPPPNPPPPTPPPPTPPPPSPSPPFVAPAVQFEPCQCTTEVDATQRCLCMPEGQSLDEAALDMVRSWDRLKAGEA